MNTKLQLLVIDRVKFWITVIQNKFILTNKPSPKLIIKYIKIFINLAYIEIENNTDLIAMKDNNPVIEAIMDSVNNEEINKEEVITYLNELHELFNKENFFKEREVYLNIVNSSLLN